MKQFNRRQFLKSSLATAASISVLPSLRVLGANEEIRGAVVGFGSRGREHIKELTELKGVRLVGLCDVDQNILDRELKKCDSSVKGYTDFRKLPESKDIDVVTFATPNHWHSLCAIW